jgi:hypothetical protein
MRHGKEPHPPEYGSSTSGGGLGQAGADHKALEQQMHLVLQPNQTRAGRVDRLDATDKSQTLPAGVKWCETREAEA